MGPANRIFQALIEAISKYLKASEETIQFLRSLELALTRPSSVPTFKNVEIKKRDVSAW